MFRTSVEQFGMQENLCEMVYYNCDIISNKTSESSLGQDPVIAFSETRQTPLVTDASKYFFCIQRASIDGAGSGLPLFIPSIEVGQSDINRTVYSVTIAFSGVGGEQGSSVQCFVEYESEATNPILPNPPTVKQDLSSKYYYVFTYSHWVMLVNNAIQAAWANIIVQAGVTPTTKPPRLMYDAVTGLFNLYCDSYGFGGSAATSQYERFTLYFNSNLYQLFRNFHFNFHGGEPNNQGMTYELVVENKLGTNIYTDPLSTKYYVVAQDFPSTDSIWSPISSIVFTTSLLCTVPEQVGVPIKFSDGNNSAQTSQSNFNNILTDIALPLTKASDYKGFIQYTANPYRWISLGNSTQEVKSIDIRLFWKNKLDNELYPITMSGLSNVSIKCCFKLKSLGF